MRTGFEIAADVKQKRLPARGSSAEHASKYEASDAFAAALHASGCRHPDANRTARFASIEIGYRLKRARRRSIGFSVGAEGLVVTAPLWLAQSAVDAALCEKAGWIVRKLAEARDCADRAEANRMVWRDRASLPFLGRALSLRLDPSLGSCGVARLEDGCPETAGSIRREENFVLRVALPADASPARIEAAVKAFLLAEAKRRLEARLAHFAPLLNVRVSRLSLGNAATRWGSASSSGSIRLHWRLVQMEPPLLDYVVVHELAHLRHMDHGERFWALVASVLQDHDELRARLKRLTLPRWD